MKYLLMCEGTVEVKVMNLLMENKKLKFDSSELFVNQIFHARQLKDNSTIGFWLNECEEEIIVYRIGDTQNDKLKIPRDLTCKIKECNIFKYCTKPEIEILLIIGEGLYEKYNHVKSKESPKSFIKKELKKKGIKYKSSPDFYQEYYGSNIELLVESIIQYRRIHKNNKEELYLSDLLK